MSTLIELTTAPLSHQLVPVQTQLEAFRHCVPEYAQAGMLEVAERNQAVLLPPLVPWIVLDTDAHGWGPTPALMPMGGWRKFQLKVDRAVVWLEHALDAERLGWEPYYAPISDSRRVFQPEEYTMYRFRAEPKGNGGRVVIGVCS